MKHLNLFESFILLIFSYMPYRWFVLNFMALQATHINRWFGILFLKDILRQAECVSHLKSSANSTYKTFINKYVQICVALLCFKHQNINVSEKIYQFIKDSPTGMLIRLTEVDDVKRGDIYKYLAFFSVFNRTYYSDMRLHFFHFLLPFLASDGPS